MQGELEISYINLEPWKPWSVLCHIIYKHNNKEIKTETKVHNTVVQHYILTKESIFD